MKTQKEKKTWSQLQKYDNHPFLLAQKDAEKILAREREKSFTMMDNALDELERVLDALKMIHVGDEIVDILNKQLMSVEIILNCIILLIDQEFPVNVDSDITINNYVKSIQRKIQDLVDEENTVILEDGWLCPHL